MAVDALPAAPAPASEQPPPATTGAIGWARANLFSTPFNTVLTVLAAWVLWSSIPPIFNWAITHAIWTVGDGLGAECKKAREVAAGACWAFIGEKHRFILFGTYPYEQHWRPLFAMLIFVFLILTTCNRRFWKPWLGLAWAVGLAACGVLMWGGVLGLSYVENENWGGLPLTLVLSAIGMTLAFPLGVLLALGRRSNLPAIKAICVAYIELIRGVPLISLLFMASVMLPLFLPAGVTFDKLLRAQVAIILFAAAYIAEVVRGGLQAIPRGQYEAADALGLGYWQKTGLIILPQALRMVIPPLVNNFIGMFKDTSLVTIIGLFDLLNATKAAMVDANWRGFALEAYLTASAIYFVFCYFMSKYSQSLEADLGRATKR
ncbi:MAG: amino acid ABC transporter permease [Alphaproteobacteria bacterium]|nr:amino acid ABC transporter permease [Alphaproteobacteria bacterium]